jgi:hypothetical protein
MNMSIEEFILKFNLIKNWFLVLVKDFWTWTIIAWYVVNFAKD